MNQLLDQDGHLFIRNVKWPVGVLPDAITGSTPTGFEITIPGELLSS